MGSLSTIPLMGMLGVLFIVFNVIILTLLILTIVFGIISFKKKKFRKTVVILLVITFILGFKDYKIISGFVNYDEIQNQELIQEEGKELVAIRDNDYDQVEEYLKNGWNPNDSTKSIFYAMKFNSEGSKEKDEWKMLELLLRYGAKPDVQISESPKGVNTPLTFATECGYYGAAELLLEYGADCNYQESYMNQNGLLALRFYENDSAAETLQLLLDYGTDLDIEQSDHKSGRDKLKNFQNDYFHIKDKVPNYDEIVKIIEGLGI